MNDSNHGIVIGTTTTHSMKFLCDLIEELLSRGNLCTLVCGEPIDAHIVRRFPGVRFVTISMARNPRPLSDLLALFSWIRLLSKLRPAVLFVGSPKASLIGLVAGVLTAVNCRVYLVRGLRFEGSRRIGRVLLSLVEAITLSLSTHRLSVSKSVTSSITANPWIWIKNIDVLGKGSSHGVRTDYFVPVEKHLSDPTRRSKNDFLTLGFVGRMTKEKGVDLLLEVFEELRAAGSPLKLLLVGPDENMKETISNLMERNSDISWTEKPSDLPSLYGSMDIFCFPSHREGLPNAILEASSCGLPVIATDVTGNRDAVVAGETGLLVPHGDKDSFKVAIKELIASSNLRNRLGKAGRVWVCENFDSHEVTKKYADFLEALSEKSRV